jgi:PAS domain S-box-containing protein
LPGVAYRCKNDPSWTIEFVSEGCLELTGYQVEDLVMNKNVSYEDLIHLDDRKMVWDTIQKALKENEPFKITYRIITADLKEKYGWEQGRGIFSPQGELIALEGFITDITKRKKAEAALKKSELYYRTIFENTGTATLIAGEDTIISLANTECENLSGYLKEEIEGKKSWMDFALEEDLEQLMNYHQLRGINQDAVPKNFEIKLINKQGDIRDVYVTIALIPYTNNRLISLLDITDKKRSRKALQESEVKFREIFNNANDMITVSEVHENGMPGRFIEVNDVASEMLGYTKEEFLNMTPFDIVHQI